MTPTPTPAPEDPRVKIYEHYLRQIARARQVSHARHLVAKALEEATAAASRPR
jgi:hypothetical protein